MKARLLIAALILMLPLGFIPAAQATPTFYFDDGAGNTLTVVDGGAGDINPAANQITVSGTVGGYTLAGISANYSLVGGSLQMNWSGTIGWSGSGSNTLTVSFLGDANTSFSGGYFSTSGTQAIGGLVSLDSKATYGGVGGTPVGAAISVDTRPTGTIWSKSQDFMGTPDVTGIYATTTLTFYGAGYVNPTMSLSASVPEPSTLLLLGLGLAGVGLFRMRKKR